MVKQLRAKAWTLEALLWILGIVLMAGCSNPASNSGSTDGINPSGGTAINKSIVLKDSTGTTLGYVTDSSGYSLTVYSPTGYFYSLTWDGNFGGFAYWTGQNGTGTPFTMNATPYYGKTIQGDYNGTLYAYSNVDSNGLSVADGTITTYSSIQSGSASAENYPSAQAVLSSPYSCYPLSPITRSTAGIPATITLPLVQVFQ